MKCELMIVGAGIAGNASALFASNRGISTIQAGIFGEIFFSSGLFDLMGVHPVSKGKKWDNPWEAIDALKKDIPLHPYAKINKKNILLAMDEFMSFLKDAGLSYRRQDNRNSQIVTPIGTLKQTWCVPGTMWGGISAFTKKMPCLILGFEGFKGFSAHQIREVLKSEWPDLRSAIISFPEVGKGRELYAEHAARYLELPENRTKLADRILPLIKNAEAVGMPSLLGISNTEEVFSDLEIKLGVKLFEMPGLPPSVNGLRLHEAFERHLPNRGVKILRQKRVLGVKRSSNQTFVLDVGRDEKEIEVKAENIILATGRFFGKGLSANGNTIHETLMHLPVFQPKFRNQWYQRDLLDINGHSINMAGLETDDMFRPVDASGKPAFDRLFAAGSILAHQDWKRMKCGTGLAVATGFAAVKAIIDSKRVTGKRRKK